MTNDQYDSDLEFEDEILVPRINMLAYRRIYTTEGWMRRICLAAWMARFGADWTRGLEPRLSKLLESRARHNRRRVYLGAESSADLVWEATSSELLQMLSMESVADVLLSMTGVTAEFLSGRLDEIREIRNVLAHNRALSSRTVTILWGAIASLDETVETFKARVIYSDMEDLRTEDEWLGQRLAKLLENNDWAKFQGFIARRGEFLEYYSLPVYRTGSWPDAALLLSQYSQHIDGIVAFCLNKAGEEFGILTPSVLTRDSQSALCDTFARNPNVWTDIPFEAQHPRFVCSPKIWFYENSSRDDLKYLRPQS